MNESLKYSKRDFHFIPSIQQALLTATEAKKLFWREKSYAKLFKYLNGIICLVATCLHFVCELKQQCAEVEIV